MKPLPDIEPDDLPHIFKEQPIEVRDKSDAYWMHAPILWLICLGLTIIGKDPSSFSQGMPLPWWHELDAIMYPRDGVDVADIRHGRVGASDMPLVVHELTHCLQAIELGMLHFLWIYLIWPLPTYWTGRSSLEWEADANEILWLVRRYAYGGEQWIDGLVKSSADTFTGPTYLWATTDDEGWIRAMRRIIGTSRMVDGIDARDTEFSGLVQLFGGYEYRG